MPPVVPDGSGMDAEAENLSLVEEPKSANRLFIEGSMIALVFAVMTVAVGFTSIVLSGGFTDIESRQYLRGLATLGRFGPLGLLVAFLVICWTLWLWRLFSCVREFRMFSDDEWRQRPDELARLFREVHDIPYRAGFSSFMLWVSGGMVSIFFFRDLPSTVWWVVPVIAISSGLSINMPQTYALKSLLATVEGEIQRLNPAIGRQDLQRRTSISRKLRGGLFGLLALTLAVAFLISFLLVERYRIVDRVDRLESMLTVYEDWIQRVSPSDTTLEDLESWAAPLRHFRVGTNGGPVLYDLTNRRFVVNVPEVPETQETVNIMLGSTSSFAEDYEKGVTYRSLREDLFDSFSLNNRYRLLLAERHELGSGGFVRNTLVVYAMLSVLCLLISYYLSRDLIIPVSRLLKYMKRTGQGRLILRRPFVSSDELGELAEETVQTVVNLAGIVTDIRHAGTSVSEASGSVAAGSIALAEASRQQLSQAEATARAVDLLAGRLEGSRQEIDRLEEAVSGTSSAAIELHMSAQQVNDTTTELASEMERIRSASEVMVDSTEHLVGRLKDLESYTDQTVGAVQMIEDRVAVLRKDAGLSEQLSSDVLANTQAGRSALEATVRSITDSRRLIADAAGIVVSLRNRNRAINEIIETIRSVASRTTLLSLNASILAAQAGEHGLSFQVVAEEIRQLANSTTARAREITELIETIQIETENAAQAIGQVADQADQNVALAEGTSRTLDEITRKAESSLTVVERTGRAVDDQSRSTREINEVVQQLGELVREFTRLGASQKDAGTRIAQGIEQVREQVVRVGRASKEQVRASGQVTEGVETVSHTLQSVLRTLNEEIGASGDIRQSAASVRETASQSTDKTDEMVKLARDLKDLAERLRKDVDRFQIEGELPGSRKV